MNGLGFPAVSAFQPTTYSFSGFGGFCAAWVCVCVHGASWAQLSVDDNQRPNTANTAPLLLVTPPRTVISTMIESRIIATDNAGIDPGGLKRADLVIEVQPSVSVERRSRDLRLRATAAVGELAYARRTQPSQFLKRGRFDMSAELVENLLFVDGWARVDPSLQDSLASRADAATSYRLAPLRRFSVSPSIRKRFNDVDSVAATTSFTESHYSDLVSRARVAATRTESSLSFEHAPRPFGISTELLYEKESNGLSSTPILDNFAWRQGFLIAVKGQLTLSLVAGNETVKLPNSSSSGHIYGSRVRWNPSERSNINIDVERRYFGNAWQASLSHHSPAMAVDFNLSKQVSSQQSPSVVFEKGQNTRDILNSILITRFADPGERQRQVDRIVASNGLPTIASENTSIYSTDAQIRQSASFQAGVLGVRNIVYFQYGYLKQTALQLPNQTLPAASDYDNVQKTFGITWNTRLTPFTSLNLIKDYSRLEVTGGPLAGQYSSQTGLRGELAFILSPRSTATVGIRKTSIRSNFLSATDLQGSRALYMGLLHRF